MDKFLSWDDASFRTAKNPDVFTSPVLLLKIGTTVDTAVDTSLDGLVADSSAAGIFFPSSLLYTTGLVRSSLPSLNVFRFLLE